MKRNGLTKIKKISFIKRTKDVKIQPKDNGKTNSLFSRVQSSKEIDSKNGLHFNDPFKQKMVNIIKKGKSRQKVFSKSQYLFYGKNMKDIKTNSILKSTREMENKFYIRNKEGLKREYNSDSLLKMLKREPTKVLEKIIFNYIRPTNKTNNDSNKEKENMKDNLKNSKSSFLPPEQKKIKGKLNHTIIISRNIKPKKEKNNYSNSSSNIFSSNMTKVNNSFSKINNDKKQLDLEDIANHNIMMIKRILKNRIKQNSKMLCDSILSLGENSLPYEPINKEVSNKNVGQKIYINKANLTRLIKVMKIVKKGFYEDDDISGIKDLKYFKKNQNYNSKHLKINDAPKSVKTKHFSKSTIFRYNQLYGNYFGVPV